MAQEPDMNYRMAVVRHEVQESYLDPTGRDSSAVLVGKMVVLQVVLSEQFLYAGHRQTRPASPMDCSHASMTLCCCCEHRHHEHFAAPLALHQHFAETLCRAQTVFAKNIHLWRSPCPLQPHVMLRCLFAQLNVVSPIWELHQHEQCCGFGYENAV